MANRWWCGNGWRHWFGKVDDESPRSKKTQTKNFIN